MLRSKYVLSDRVLNMARQGLATAMSCQIAAQSVSDGCLSGANNSKGPCQCMAWLCECPCGCTGCACILFCSLHRAGTWQDCLGLQLVRLASQAKRLSRGVQAPAVGHCRLAQTGLCTHAQGHVPAAPNGAGAAAAGRLQDR